MSDFLVKCCDEGIKEKLLNAIIWIFKVCLGKVVWGFFMGYMLVVIWEKVNVVFFLVLFSKVVWYCNRFLEVGKVSDTFV